MIQLNRYLDKNVEVRLNRRLRVCNAKINNLHKFAYFRPKNPKHVKKYNFYYSRNVKSSEGLQHNFQASNRRLVYVP
jgi:hypothetical protein